MSVRNRYELYLMIFHFYCVNPWNRCIICRCFWKNIIRYRNINNYVLSLYISFDRRSRSFLFKKGEGWGTVRFLYAVNVVILIIFFFSFHNNTSVVWISKTVSIDANYLLKLETFLIQFYEGKGTCMRSSEGDQLFPGKKKKKSPWRKVGNLSKLFFSFLVTSSNRKQTDSIGLKPKIIEKIYTNLAKSFFRNQLFSTE